MTTTTASRVERITEGRWHDLARQHEATAWTCVCPTPEGAMRVTFATIAKHAEIAACGEADKYAAQLWEHPEFLPTPSSRKSWIFSIEKEPTQ